LTDCSKCYNSSFGRQPCTAKQNYYRTNY